MNEATLDKQPARLSHIRQAVAALVETLAPQLKAMRDRNEALERRVAQLETKPHVKFCGVWDASATYEKGDACTRSGSLWICTSATTVGVPGQDFSSWQMAVKNGGAR